MTDSIDDWRSFLARWSQEWADVQDPDAPAGERDAEALRSRWLGFPPASEERILALEERLGHRLPPRTTPQSSPGSTADTVTATARTPLDALLIGA